MNPLEELFPEKELIEFLAGFEIDGVDMTELSGVNTYANTTYNPFDVDFGGIIYLDNRLMIVFSKDGDEVDCRVGVDKGWIGGLEPYNNRLAFTIKEITLDEFKRGFTEFYNNPQYSLASKYASGSFLDVKLVGSLDELERYALSNGYEKKTSPDSDNTYYFDGSREKWDSENILQVYVLSPKHIYNIRNHRNRFKK